MFISDLPFPMLLAAEFPVALDWLIVLYAWLFVFGGVIGSFLNVVVYRVPAGTSIVEPPSHCPACEHPIRWFDNVPVLSWIILRGRCRDCRAPISIRYPAVEACTAMLFLVLGLAEPLDLCAYHLLLMCTLLVVVLVEYDGHRLPAALFFPALVGGAFAPMIWPSLRPVHVVAALDGQAAGLVDGAVGLAAGATLGLLLSRTVGSRQQRATFFGPACVGLFLGAQAVVVVTAVAAAIGLLFWPVGRLSPSLRRIPAVTWLAAATLAWILLWDHLVARWPLLG